MRQRDARPVLPHAIRILGEIGRRVADGQRVEPDQRGRVGVGIGILDSKLGEISAGRGREVCDGLGSARPVGGRGFFKNAAELAVAVVFLLRLGGRGGAEPERNGDGIGRRKWSVAEAVVKKTGAPSGVRGQFMRVRRNAFPFQHCAQSFGRGSFHNGRSAL